MSVVQALLSCFDEYVETMEVPAAEAVEALLLLLKAGEADKFLEVMNGDAEARRQHVELLKRSFEENPAWMEKQMLLQSAELRAAYLDAARQKLASVTAFVYVDAIERSQAEKMHLMADTKHQLLQLSVAEEFLSRLPAGFNRAKELSDWSVKEPSSEQADSYLSEACNCFLFMLDTACVVMCRSLLEEVMERKIPPALMNSEGLLRPKDRMLGRLLDVVNNNLQELKIHPEVPSLVSSVNKIASGAAHHQPVDGHAAFRCLQTTRKAILYLL